MCVHRYIGCLYEIDIQTFKNTADRATCLTLNNSLTDKPILSRKHWQSLNIIWAQFRSTITGSTYTSYY